MTKQKDSQKHEIPTLYDISGSAHFYNKTHNGITVYRNFPDEEGKGGSTDIHIQKVKYRWHGKTGILPMQFNPQNGRYHVSSSDYDDWLAPTAKVQELPMPQLRQVFDPADSIAANWDADFEIPF